MQWFIDNKLSIHFGEDKTKSILFLKTRGLKEINIKKSWAKKLILPRAKNMVQNRP